MTMDQATHNRMAARMPGVADDFRRGLKPRVGHARPLASTEIRADILAIENEVNSSQAGRAPA
jgi:hypothetical protein